MYAFLEGRIDEVRYDHIVIEVNGVGYLVYVSRPNDFHINSQVRIHVYHHVKEDGHLLYGFSSRDEKELFLRLINVSGIGPKTAIGVVGNATVSSLIQAIETGNTTFLRKLPGIGPKAAQQIILDLKGKLILDANPKVTPKNSAALEDAKAGLRSLGFKVSEIDNAMNSLAALEMTSEEYLRAALKILKK